MVFLCRVKTVPTEQGRYYKYSLYLCPGDLVVTAFISGNSAVIVWAHGSVVRHLVNLYTLPCVAVTSRFLRMFARIIRVSVKWLLVGVSWRMGDFGCSLFLFM